MKHQPLKKDIISINQLDIYYSKLGQISNILSTTEIEIYFLLSELIRGEDINSKRLKISTHKRFVRDYLKINNNKNNGYIIDFLNTLKDTICATHNSASVYFIRSFNKQPCVNKKLNRKIK